MGFPSDVITIPNFSTLSLAVSSGLAVYQVGNQLYVNSNPVISFNPIIISKGIVLTEYTNGIASLWYNGPDAGSTVATSTEFGGNGIKITKNTGAKASSFLQSELSKAFMLEASTNIVIKFKVTRGNNINIDFRVSTQSSNYVGYCRLVKQVSNTMVRVDASGFGILSFSGADLIAAGGGDNSIISGSMIDTIQLAVSLSIGADITIIGVYLNPCLRPTMAISFDDGWASVYYEAWTYLNRYGIAGTLAVNGGLIGLTGYMTLAQINEIAASGWPILNHSYLHKQVVQGLNAIGSTGIGPNNQICVAQAVAAGGSFNFSGATVGSAVFDQPRQVYAVSSSTGNQYSTIRITGVDENNATITEIVTLGGLVTLLGYTVWKQITSITLDQATSGVTTISIGQTLSYAEVYNEVYLNQQWLINNHFTRGGYMYVSPMGASTVLHRRVLAACGYTAMRGTIDNLEFPNLCPNPLDMAALLIGPEGYAVDNPYIDSVVSGCSCGQIAFHDIVADTATPDSIQIKRADFRAVIDHVFSYIKTNQLTVVDMLELHDMFGY